MNTGTSVVVDVASTSRYLVWHAADQRIKAFSITHKDKPPSCEYTLYAGHGGSTSMAIHGNRLYSGVSKLPSLVWGLVFQRYHAT
jgi:hypothetical protein